jgi:hypothetical protein
MSFDAYEVAINLKLEDQFSDAIGLFSNKLGESSKHAEELQKKLEKLKEALKGASSAATGVQGFGDAADKAAGKWQKLADKVKETYKTAAKISLTGVGMAVLLKGPLEHAAKQEQQVIKLDSMNFDGTLDKGTKAALAAHAANIAKSAPGTTDADALRIATESQVITGDVKKTVKLAPMVANLRFDVEAMATGNGEAPGKGDEAEKKFFELMQKLKDSGVTKDFTEAKYRAVGDLYLKSYLAQNGDVDEDKFMATAKAMAKVKDDKDISSAITDENIRRAQGVEELAAQEKRSGAGMKVDLTSKWHELEEQFGRAALPVVKGLVDHLIPALKSLGDWMEEHQDAVTNVAKGFIWLSAGLMIVGPLFAIWRAFKILDEVLSLGMLARMEKLRGGIRSLAGAVTPRLVEGIVSIGARLAGLGMGIVRLAATVMTNPYVLAITGAAAAGYAAGTAINGGISWAMNKATNGRVNSLGEGLFNLFNPGEASAAEHDKKLNAQIAERLAQARAARAQTTVHTTINIDGRKVGHAVTRHQAAEAARPSAGQAAFDRSMMPAPVGA